MLYYHTVLYSLTTNTSPNEMMLLMVNDSCSFMLQNAEIHFLYTRSEYKGITAGEKHNRRKTWVIKVLKWSHSEWWEFVGYNTFLLNNGWISVESHIYNEEQTPWTATLTLLYFWAAISKLLTSFFLARPSIFDKRQTAILSRLVHQIERLLLKLGLI